jgi:hypothetical protein
MPRPWRPVIRTSLLVLLAACGGGSPPLATIEPIAGSRTREGGEIVPLDSSRTIRRTAEGNPVREIVPLARGGASRGAEPAAGEIRRLGETEAAPAREIRRLGDTTGTGAHTIPPLNAPSGPADTLAGTTWDGEGLDGAITFEFLAGGALRYTTEDQTFENGTWEQTGNVVSLQMNERFAEWSGRIGAARMSGSAHNRAGRQWNWQADRR